MSSKIWRELFQGKTFWRFSLLICSSVACSYIIISKIYSFQLKCKLQKLMQVKGSVFKRWFGAHWNNASFRVSIPQSVHRSLGWQIAVHIFDSRWRLNCRDFINDFSRRETGFHKWSKPFWALLNFLIKSSSETVPDHWWNSLWIIYAILLIKSLWIPDCRSSFSPRL